MPVDAQHPKVATPDHPILAPLRERWSPRAFADRPVASPVLQQLFEAARWAPSSFNEQPWRFIVGARAQTPGTYERLLACLNEKNQSWARTAPVLLLALAKRTFSRNGKPNRHAWHDLGLAMGALLTQATALGVYAHQMAGIDPEQARATFHVPDDFDVVTGVALGYPGDPAVLPASFREGEAKPRTRHPIGAFTFGGTWDTPSTLLAPPPEEPSTNGA